MNPTVRKLHRSRKDTKILGLCGGLGEYLEVDPTVVRLLWVLGTVLTGFLFGTIAYFVAGLIVPLEPWTAPAAEPRPAPSPGETQQQHG